MIQGQVFRVSFYRYMDYDEETKQMSDDYGIDIEEAEQARELMDEYGIDEDDAVELQEYL